jgi:hypothetical protein
MKSYRAIFLLKKLSSMTVCFRKQASLQVIICNFRFTYINQLAWFGFIGFTILDHPIHPPPHVLSSHNNGKITPPANYVIKVFNGVFQVYENQDAAENGESLNFSYTVFEKYIDDVNKMCNMISNRPL